MREYRKETTVMAEQFDGSDKMAEKYGLKKFGWQGFVKEFGRNDFELGGPLLISSGDWVHRHVPVKCGDSRPYNYVSEDSPAGSWPWSTLWELNNPELMEV